MECPILLGFLLLSVVMLIAVSSLLKVAMDVARGRTRALRALCVQLSVQTTALLAVRDEKRSTLRLVNERSRELATLRQTLSSTEETLERLQHERASAKVDAVDAHERADALAAKLAAALDRCDALDNRLSQAHRAHLELVSKLHADASLRTAAVLSLTQPQVSVPNAPPVSESVDLCEDTMPSQGIDSASAFSSGPTATVSEAEKVSVPASSPNFRFTMPAPNLSVGAGPPPLENHREVEAPNRNTVLSEEVQPESAEIDVAASGAEQGGLLSLRPNLSISSSSSSSTSSNIESDVNSVENEVGVSPQPCVETPREDVTLSGKGSIHHTASRQVHSLENHVLELHRAPWADATHLDLRLGGINGLRILTTDRDSYSGNSYDRIAFSTGLVHRVGSSDTDRT